MRLGINKNKRGRFAPFWIMIGVLFVFLLGALITPMKYVLDDTFRNIEENAVNNGTPELSCTNTNAPGWFKGTCFTLGGFVSLFFIYLIYQLTTAMVNGAKKNGAVFAPRYRRMQAALEQ